MRRFTGAIFGLLCFFVATSVAHSQTSTVWFTLNAPEGSVITASAPITLRYGQVASTCAYNLAPGLCYGVPLGTPTPETWTSPQTFALPSGSSTVSVTVSNNTFGGDPLPGVYKTVQIQEQSTAQTITVNGQAVTVPALSGSSGSPSPTVWFTLNAPEGSVITASAPITLRYGQVASTCTYNGEPGPCYGVPIGTPSPETWTSPQTFSPPSGSSTVSVTVNNDSFGGDPLPGVYKTVQIQEQSTVQTISVNGQSVTVPAVGSSACQLTANPSAITFQNTTVGYTLAASGSLTNNCSSSISVSAIQVLGPYSVSGVQAPFSIAPNQTQGYSVVFAPVSAGVGGGTITFVNSANSGVSVTLSGTGVAPQSTLSASPSSLSFGNVAVNTSTSLTLTITNSGSASVSISSVSISGTGYTVSGVTTPFTLGANKSQQLTVVFSPATTGSTSGTLTITTSGSALTVPLSGSGVASTPAHSVSLSWNASSSQVFGYNVYRSTTSSSGYALLTSSPITTTSFTDAAVTAGAAYYYVVTAVDPSGVESTYSNEISVTIPSP